MIFSGKLHSQKNETMELIHIYPPAGSDKNKRHRDFHFSGRVQRKRTLGLFWGHELILCEGFLAVVSGRNNNI
jgi:hypothetical protein